MDSQKMIANQTDVALLIAKHLMSNDAKEKNFVFSPPSIYVMLSLVAAGANGKALDDLTRFLKSNKNDLNYLAAHLGEVVFADGSSLGGPNISFVNGAWVDVTMPFSKDFRNIAESFYKANIEQVDFQNKTDEAIERVNSWAEKETNGLIKRVVDKDSVDFLTRFILANAIYFKGTWAENFDTSDTKVQSFHLLDGSSVEAPFMNSWRPDYISIYNGFKVLELPYRHDKDKRQFSMSIFLPDEKDGLPALAEKFCLEPGFITKQTPTADMVEVGRMQIPKFKISYGIKMASVFKDLGLIWPFESCQGLTEMTDSPLGKELSVSGISHKAFIEVNEEGTEAAAVTTVTCSALCSSISQTIDFVADHPFLFVIRENVSGVVLFIGHVLNPVG